MLLANPATVIDLNQGLGHRRMNQGTGPSGASGDPTPGFFDYLRPDGTSYFKRPDGTSYYTRP